MQHIPSLHALRAFEAAARLRSFARASEELHLTPSAVSHQVRSLEQHFGSPLFARANRQVSLTPDGERLFVVLAQAFGLIYKICSDLSPPAETQDLAVHCTPSLATKWLGPRLPSFIAQNPTINIRLSSNADPIDLLRNESIDIAIAYAIPPSNPGITVLSLGQEEFSALCSPLFAAEHVPSDINALVKLGSTLSPVSWDDWFKHNGMEMNIARNGPSFDRGSLVVAAAAQGLGVALETLRFAEDEIKNGSLVRLGGEQYAGIKRDLHYLCFRTRDQNMPKIKSFCDWILAQAQTY
ncbi:MAG: LysR family transcriptional regulator [Pseudomonas sp.]|uniref:LysR substrate-binding domain-containing protein n=1 Tax=Pseudomonas sp. TaxID=306 RepID=UPI001A621E73|nr:LysR substrate-binding domain-containing protein [Pseudomonas sp.]MBL7229464.1 LysR family transcriptional regulator [Pseudomonas sp.]